MHARQTIPQDRYADTVVQECAARAPLFSGRRAQTLYFGGGTPSLWRPDCVERVVAEIRRTFQLATDSEITLEANPDLLPGETLAALLKAGINRLSLGAQSFSTKSLQLLGRLHQGETIRQAMKNARAVGFQNISIDLMFALPEQSTRALDRELDQVLALKPDHISLYSLTIESRTAFAALVRDKKMVPLEDDKQAALYEQIQRRLGEAGFEQYEISSYARPGKRSVHNSNYWRQGEYLGLGSGAHSHRMIDNGGSERFSNPRSVDDYFAMTFDETWPSTKFGSYETLDRAQVEREAIWLGLRELDGIDRRVFQGRFGADLVIRHGPVVDRLVEQNLIYVTNERIALSSRGVLFADEIGARFLSEP